MSRFFILVPIILLTIQLVALIIWRRRLSQRPRLRLTVTLLFVAGNLPWLLFFHISGQPDLPPHWVIATIIRPFTTWQGGIWIWLHLMAAFSLLGLLFWRWPRRLIRKSRAKGESRTATVPMDSGRRDFLVTAARGAAYAGFFSLSGWGLARAGRQPIISRYDIILPNLPPHLEGFSIAHLTDLHVGLWTSEEEVARVLDLTRQLKPDLVVITGDIVDHQASYAASLTRHLPLLSAVPLGVFAVIGNHDIYTGADQVTAALANQGVTMLRNNHHNFNKQGLPLTLIGVDDPGRQWTGSGGPLPLKTAMKGLSPEDVPILLAHRPTSFDQARPLQIPLTLCGHTHGGQFAAPNGSNLADLAYQYTHGLYEKSGCQVHVSAGIGAVGLPFRLGVPPEIGLLRLTGRKHV